MAKKGTRVTPVVIEGRKIADSFWGKAWCDHIESFCDFDNRLPRGRTYVRNGSVCHLSISPGKVDAKVSGTSLYTVRISMEKLALQKWNAIKQQSSGRIASLIALLQGKLSADVMQVVIDHKSGLFPLSGEMKFQCSCPDWADMCKHVAAVLYGVGARLDKSPQELFKLRGVNHEDLILADAESAVSAATTKKSIRRLKEKDLADVFGIELIAESPHPSAAANNRPIAETNTPTRPRKSNSQKRIDTAVALKPRAVRKQIPAVRPPKRTAPPITRIADLPQTTRHAAHNHKPKIASTATKSRMVIQADARRSSKAAATKQRKRKTKNSLKIAI